MSVIYQNYKFYLLDKWSITLFWAFLLDKRSNSSSSVQFLHKRNKIRLYGPFRVSWGERCSVHKTRPLRSHKVILFSLAFFPYLNYFKTNITIFIGIWFNITMMPLWYIIFKSIAQSRLLGLQPLNVYNFRSLIRLSLKTWTDLLKLYLPDVIVFKV